MRAGVIVAGGRSTRFGEEDKAVAELAGTPMIRRVADRIGGVVDALVVNCRDDQVPAIERALEGYERPVTFAPDPDPDRGPTAGIRTGLRAVEDLADAAEDPYAFVAACDMPFVDPSLVEYLFERAAGRDAAVPRLGEWFEPTHAVYRPGPMADACDETLEAGERRVVAPLFEIDHAVVEESELRERGSLDSFENVNTREEFREAADRLS